MADAKQRYYLDSLETSDGGTSEVYSSYQMSDLPVRGSGGAPMSQGYGGEQGVGFSGFGFSKRKATTVSIVITVVVTAITGASLITLGKQTKNNAVSNRPAIVSQDAIIQDKTGTTSPIELENEEDALLVNGDIITRGQIKVSTDGFVAVIRPLTLTKNQSISLPDASGTICLSSNNCAYASTSEVAQLRQQLGQLTTPATSSVITTINGSAGAVAIQGTSNQISVSTINGVVRLSTPQDLAPISSPTFSNLLLSGNFSLSGAITLPVDCSSQLNGGNLTTNGAGQIICADDDGGAGGGTVSSPGGTAGSLAVFTAAQTLASSIISQSLGAITIGGNTTVGGSVAANSLTLVTPLGIASGGTGRSSFTLNGVVYGNASAGLLSTAAPLSGQVIVGNASGVPQFVSISGDISLTGAGVATIQADSVSLGVDTSGSYVSNLGALTGLSVTGNSGEGSTPALSVVYGSGANTSVQGNTSVTISSGANLSGGGAITLGAGGSLTLNVVDNPSFAGDITAQGGDFILGTIAQSASFILHDGSGQTVTFTPVNLSANRAYTLPDASGELCLTSGNCAGSGGGVTTVGGTTNRLAKFSGAQSLADSSILDNGTAVTISGTANLVVQGGTATIGDLSQAATLSLSDGSSNTVSIVVAGLAADRTYTLPDAGGNASFCLSTGNCIGGAGGSAPSNATFLVMSLDGSLSSERALAAGSNISFTDGGANSNFTVATVQNPSFNTSITTPLLQSSGALALTSASGNVISVDSSTTIELQDSTNITGSLDVSSGFSSGTSNAFQVNASGAITAASGINSSGTIIFSGLNCTGNANGGALTANGSGQIICSDDNDGSGGSISGSGTSGTLPVFSGAQVVGDSIITQSGTTISIAGDLTLTSDLTVANGGTGASSFTSNGVIFGNGAGALQVTAAGTSGQVLVANGSGLPAFVSFSGDVAVSATGSTTIQANSVALGTDTTGGFVGALGTLTGLSTTGNAGEGSTPTISVDYGSSANTAVQGNVILTCPSGTGNLSGGGTAITLGTGGTCGSLTTVNNPTFSTSVTTASLLLTGGSFNMTLQSASLGQATAITFPDPTAGSATVCYQNSTSCGFAPSTGGGGYIQNQNSINQSADFRITGTGRANTSILTPLLDTATSVALDIGGSGATAINLNQHTVLAATKNLTVTSGTSTFNGTVSVAGTTTLTVGTGLTTLGGGLTATGAVNLNTTGTANTSIGNASGTLALTSNAFNLNTSGAISGVTGYAQASGNFLQSGAGTFGTATGAVSLNGDTTLATAKNFTVTAGSSSLTGAVAGGGTALTVNSGAATNTGLLIQGAASQTGDLLQVKANGISNPLLNINANGHATFHAAADSTSAFLVQNAVGSNVISVSSNGGATMTLGHYGTGLVGHVANVVNASYYATTTNTRSFAIGKSVPAGHTLVGAVVTSGVTLAGTVTVADTQGNTYTVDAQYAFGSTASTYIFSAPITAPLTTSDTLTITFSSSYSRWLVDVQEFDNILTSSYVDQTAVNGASGVTALSSGATGVTTNSYELVFGSFGYGSGRTFVPGTGFNASAQVSTAGGSSDRALSNVWKFVTNTGSQTATGVINTSSTYAAGVVTYKANVADVSAAGAIALNDGSTNNYFGTLGISSLTTNRTVSLPDESGIICLQSSASCGFIQSQNAAQQSATNFWISGTGRSDVSLLTPSLDRPTAGTLSVGTSTATAITVGKSGIITTNAGDLTSTGVLTANGGVVAAGVATGSTNAATINTGATTNVGLLIQGIASQSANMFEVRANGVANALASIGSSGAINFRNSSNSTTGFRIQNAGGVEQFTVDTTAATPHIYVGPTAGDTVGTLFVLGNKTNSGDPSGVEGAMYYNSSSKSFRCYANGVWRSCMGGVIFANTSVPGGNTVANTASETNFASNYTIPANDCQPGRVYKITAQGVYGTTGTPTLTLRAKMGSTVLGSTGTYTTTSQTNAGWRVEFQATCDTTGASGTVEGQGIANMATGASTADTAFMANTGTVTIDTTSSQVLQLSSQWGTANAANTITLRQVVIESSGP